MYAVSYIWEDYKYIEHFRTYHQAVKFINFQLSKFARDVILWSGT